MKFHFFICVVLLVVGCKTKPVVQTRPDPVILTIGNQQIKTADFFQSFTKNQFSSDTSKQTSLSEYLELYTNLKLKIISAQSKGLDTTSDFKEEMATLRKQLAQPYLTDKNLIESLTAEAYQRSQEEIRASHILIKVPQNASPADTLSAYRAALALRGRIVEGEDFAEMAKKFSKDIQTADNGGDLGYFSIFQMVYPFETAAYKTPIGKISDPIRTVAGYHLIKVIDRRPARNKLQVAHILVSVSNSANPEGQIAAKARIEEAFERIRQGEAFEVVCREYSDDRTTKNNSGLLTPFGTGQWVRSFEDVAYSLKNVGDISNPFKTNYGWHIIKLVARLPKPSFNEAALSLRQKITTDSRKEIIAESLSQKLRKSYKISEQGAVKEATFALLDSSLLSGHWKRPNPAIEDKQLLSIENQLFTNNQLLDFIYKKQEPQPTETDLKVLAQSFYKRFVDRQLSEYEEANLDKKYPEFKSLLSEINDGVLLSKMMEDNVWHKSIVDTTLQRTYYQANKEKYSYPERAIATIVTSDNDSLISYFKQALKNKPYQLRQKGEDLIFEANKTDLTVKHRESLFDVAVVLMRNDNYIVEISGYSDKNEPDSVSKLRIKNAVKSLTNNQIALHRIMEKDYGKFKPNPNSAMNRRVSFQFFTNSKKDIEKTLNNLKIGTAQVTDGIFLKGTNNYLTNWKKGIGQFEMNGKKVLTDITSIEPPRIKTLNEARGAVINDLQRQLEQDWLSKLKQQFPVSKNEEEIKKISYKSLKS